MGGLATSRDLLDLIARVVDRPTGPRKPWPVGLYQGCRGLICLALGNKVSADGPRGPLVERLVAHAASLGVAADGRS